MKRSMIRWAALALGLAATAAGAATSELRVQQLTATGPECAGGGSYYPSVDARAANVAFTSWCDLVPGQNTAGRSELFVMRSDGSGLRQLTHTAGTGFAMEPSISPDGHRIAFASSADLLPGQNADGNFEIFVIDADGSGLAQLTHTTGGRVNLGFAGNTHPIIDPSGSRIVFSSDRDLVPGGNADGNNDLFAMNTDGSGLQQLTFTSGGWGVNQGSLDQTGTRLLFDSDRDLVPGQNSDGGSEIFVMNLGGGGLAQLTHADSSDGHIGNTFPRWTPDGQSIFFASDQDLLGGSPSGNYEVFHIAGDGSGLVQVTSCIGGFGAVPWGVAHHGRTVSIESDCDLVPGANLDRNGELFLQTWRPAPFVAANATSRQRSATSQAAANGNGARRPTMAPRF